MLFLLSPAKTLDYESPLAPLPHTRPRFVAQSQRLIEVLRGLAPRELSRLMDISDELAGLNAARYQAWSSRFTARNSRQAILAFNGDVYEGLDARTLDADDLAWAQDHLRMLSGLYGVLRPLDLMQPYRLEMGTRLAVDGAPNLYAFWGEQIARSLNQDLRAQARGGAGTAEANTATGEPVVINLASQEYFRSVDARVLRARVVECVFEEWRGAAGGWKVISFMAKRARGLMARHAVRSRARSVRDLENFSAEGYALDRAASASDRLVFRRKQDS